MFESVFAMCLIKDVYNDRRYIAAQGPIDESVTDFLRMIWEFQITSVVCTANDIEAGRVNHEWVFINESIPFLFLFSSSNSVVIGQMMKDFFNSVVIVSAKYIASFPTRLC